MGGNAIRVALFVATAFAFCGNSVAPVYANALQDGEAACDNYDKIDRPDKIAFCIKNQVVIQTLDAPYFSIKDPDYKALRDRCVEEFKGQFKKIVECRSDYFTQHKIDKIFREENFPEIEGSTCNVVFRYLDKFLERGYSEYRNQLTEDGCDSVAGVYEDLAGEAPYWKDCRGNQGGESLKKCVPILSDDEITASLESCSQNVTKGGGNVLIYANQNSYIYATGRGMFPNPYPKFDCLSIAENFSDSTELVAEFQLKKANYQHEINIHQIRDLYGLLVADLLCSDAAKELATSGNNASYWTYTSNRLDYGLERGCGLALAGLGQKFFQTLLVDSSKCTNVRNNVQECVLDTTYKCVLDGLGAPMQFICSGMRKRYGIRKDTATFAYSNGKWTMTDSDLGRKVTGGR